MVPRESSTPYSSARLSRSSASFDVTSRKTSVSSLFSSSRRRPDAGHLETEVGVVLEQLLDVAALELGDHRVLHRLRHLLARAALDEAGLAEHLRRAAVVQGQRLAVAGDLGDLDASAVDDEHRVARIAGQVHHLAAAHLAELDSLGQAREHLRTELSQDRDLLEVPERSFRILHRP
jgi:hypothetical protein